MPIPTILTASPIHTVSTAANTHRTASTTPTARVWGSIVDPQPDAPRRPRSKNRSADDLAEWKRMRHKTLALVICLAATACAGRAPNPVAVVQPTDRFMDCPAIFAEVQANNAKLQELASESGGKVAQNVAAGVVGLVIWPVWFGMDFQGTADKEATALNSRQQYLATLAEQRQCGAAAQPRRIG